MRKPFAPALLGLVLVVVGSCGGDDEETTKTCGAFTACGGTVQTGNYKITGSCMNATGMFESERLPNCKNGTLELSNYKASGTVTLNADMTYARSLTSKATTKVSVPSSCLNFGGLQIPCSTVDAMLKESAAGETSTIESVSCTGTTTCVCTAVMKETTETETGGWATAGQTVTLTAAGKPAQTYGYCAKGSKLELDLGALPMSVVGVGNLTLRGSMTLTKQ